MNCEISPCLYREAEKILETQSSLRGKRYLKSGVKRTLDLFVAVPSSPFAAAAAGIAGALVYIDDRGRPFVDVGLKDSEGIPPTCFWKVRTMVVGAQSMERGVVGDEGLAEFKRKARQGVVEDHRITRVGSFLRKTSIDEMPQVLNALRGDISFVGPRIPSISDWHDHIKPNVSVHPYRDFIDQINNGMKFGITGLYVILGRLDRSMYERIQLETMYGENASLTSDLRIIARTFPLLLKPTG